MQLLMASTANQKKIITTANKVGALADTRHMMNLHFLLLKTTTADSTTAPLTTIQPAAETDKTVTDIPTTVIILPAPLQPVSGNINTNTADLPFLQKIHTRHSYISETALPQLQHSNLGNMARSNSMAIYKSSF